MRCDLRIAWSPGCYVTLVTLAFGVLLSSEAGLTCLIEPAQSLLNHSEATLEIVLPDLFGLVAQAARKQLTKRILGELITFSEFDVRNEANGRRRIVPLSGSSLQVTEGQIMELNTALVCNVITEVGANASNAGTSHDYNVSIARLKALETILSLQGDWIALVRLESVWQEVRRRLLGPPDKKATTKWPCYSLLHQAFYAVLFGARTVVFDIGDSVLDRIRHQITAPREHHIVVNMLLFGTVLNTPDLVGTPISTVMGRKLFDKFCSSQSEKALSRKSLFFVTGRHARALVRHLEMKFAKPPRAADEVGRSVYYPPNRAFVRIVFSDASLLDSGISRSSRNRTRPNQPMKLRQLTKPEPNWLSLMGIDHDDDSDSSKPLREFTNPNVSPLNAAKVYLEIIIFVSLFFVIFVVFMATMCRVYVRQRAARNSATDQSNRFLQRRSMLREIIAQTPIRGYKPRVCDGCTNAEFVSRDATPKKLNQCNSCAICLGEFIEGNATLELPCKHVFHVNCIQRWLGIARRRLQQNGSTQLILSDRASLVNEAETSDQHQLDNRMACPLCLQDIVTTFNQRKKDASCSLLVSSPSSSAHSQNLV